jgi:hypothetical protein
VIDLQPVERYVNEEQVVRHTTRRRPPDVGRLHDDGTDVVHRRREVSTSEGVVVSLVLETLESGLDRLSRPRDAKLRDDP